MRPPRARRGSSRSPCCACCVRGSRPPEPARRARRLRTASRPRSCLRGRLPRSLNRAASSATAPGSTRPSKGHPNEHEIVTVAGVSPAAPRIASTRSVASASVAFPLRRLKVSVAANVTLTRSRSAPPKRSQPRSLSTRPESSTPSCGPTHSITSSAPAICGTRSSRTKLTASMRRSPAPASRSTSSARVSGGKTSGSFWSPSRGPTSQRSTSVTGRAYSLHPQSLVTDCYKRSLVGNRHGRARNQAVSRSPSNSLLLGWTGPDRAGLGWASGFRAPSRAASAVRLPLAL